jgi:hypothetical protein
VIGAYRNRTGADLETAKQGVMGAMKRAARHELHHPIERDARRDAQRYPRKEL